MLTLKRKLFTADPNIDMISLVRESYVEQCMVSYARSHQSSF